MRSDNTYKLEKLPHFSGRSGPGVIVIMDGIGIGRKDKGDAFYHANSPNLDKWIAAGKENNLYTELKAHGPAVGLPTDKDMGNSEVGHNALGSGQIYAQGAKQVNSALKSGEVFETEAWDYIVGHAARNQKTVHFIGLLSDGNVHSHIDQLFGLLDGVAQTGVKRIRIHPLLDGRDVPPLSGLDYIAQLEDKLDELETNFKGMDAQIASGGGRMYVTMDRYESNWNIVQRGWDAHVRGVIADVDITEDYPGYFSSAQDAIKTARKVYPKKKDQFNPPFVIVDKNNDPIGRMQDGDGVINFNFRGDRAIEISKAFEIENFHHFDRQYYPDVRYAGLLEYDTDKHIPGKFLVPPPNIQHTSGQYLCEMGISSYAIAETHKFGHVTYFWNGNRTGYFCDKLEKYIEIKSEPNEMIEGHPAMKAHEVTEELLAAIKSGKYQYLRVNYANGDMVGHTGNFEACKTAVETVDSCVGEVVEAVLNLGGFVLITADHGNAEETLSPNGKEMTSHSLNPVPFIILDSQYDGEYKIDTTNIDEPGISNVMATFMNLLGYEAPEIYEKSLVKFK